MRLEFNSLMGRQKDLFGAGWPKQQRVSVLPKLSPQNPSENPKRCSIPACNPSSQAKDKLVMRLIDLAESVAFRPVRDQVKI